MSRLWDPVGWLLRRRAPDENPRRKGRWSTRLARRWGAAATTCPALVRDVIELGGVLAPPLMRADGTDTLAMSEGELAFEAGRRAFALELLALMQVGPDELSQFMQEDGTHGPDDEPFELVDGASGAFR